MAVNLQLFSRLLARAPHQPATSFWRAIEIEGILSIPFPSGIGLDLGCGDGSVMELIREFSRTNLELLGLDADPEEVRLARDSGAYGAVLLGSAEDIELPDQSLDFVFANCVLEHIPRLDKVLDEVARLLRGGGQFVFTVPSPKFHEMLRGAVVPFVSREDYLEDIDRRLVHYHYYGADEWENLLRKRGLQLCRATGYLTRAELRRWEDISRLTAGILVALSGKQKHPIQIQRTLGIRRRGLVLPETLARNLARVLMVGLRNDRLAANEHAGLIVLAHRS
jgi:ubiquinone/menaquinone biosynthesis C-methylase UbiE